MKKEWKVGLAGERISIHPEWKVIDIGSGHNPFGRADVLLERDLGESIHRSGEKAKTPSDKILVVGDAINMPFLDKSFDYAVASHIAEHIEHIDKFIHELMRISKKGYIEVPGPLSELIFNEPYHLWIISKQGDTLVFKRKRKFKGVLSEIFYSLFYLNKERYGHRTIFSDNFILKIVVKILNRLWKHRCSPATTLIINRLKLGRQ